MVPASLLFLQDMDPNPFSKLSYCVLKGKWILKTIAQVS